MRGCRAPYRAAPGSGSRQRVGGLAMRHAEAMHPRHELPDAIEEPGANEGARQGFARPAIASPEEDPNAVVVCNSPPCFMHELDPSYLGYLGRDEVRGLLQALLAAKWSGTVVEAAWVHAMLRRHLARPG